MVGGGAADRGRFPAVLNLHVAARSEPELALGDHRLAGLQAPVNHQFLIHARAGDHRAHLDGSILLHHVNELAVLPGLHGLIGNHSGVRPRGQSQSHAHEFARPKAIGGILKSALELDGAGGGVDGIVDEGQHARFLAGGVGLGRGLHRKLALPHVTLDVAQLRFRH